MKLSEVNTRVVSVGQNELIEGVKIVVEMLLVLGSRL